MSESKLLKFRFDILIGLNMISAHKAGSNRKIDQISEKHGGLMNFGFGSSRLSALDASELIDIQLLLSNFLDALAQSNI